MLLSGDTYLVNFQLAGAPVPTRYLADTGAVFGDRGNGYFYGWSSNHADVAFDRNLAADQRLDTLIQFHQGQKWEFALPNGVYQVTVAVGDPANNVGIHTINAEGVNFFNAVPDTNSAQVQTRTVTVADGRLSVDQGSAAEMATRIDYIQIVGLPSGTNAAPATPTITEPSTNGQVVNPGDVHMEATGFSDTDGNLHKSTDWEIWTVGSGAEPVWQTLGITGVEKVHTHLGDGNFINSQAGRTTLLPNSDYQLRVRFRDDAGSVSAYATRNFHAGASSSTYPLDLEDVALMPNSYWIDSLGNDVELPVRLPTSPQLRIESPTSELLLGIAASASAGNTVTNPPALSDHADVRVVISSGSGTLNLGQTNVIVVDDHGITHTIYLPAINLGANQQAYFWVSSDGSTYFGTAVQTTPDFSSLARASDAAVTNPFTPMQPRFAVDEVAGGFQLPVNIAFVPKPGPNANDPLFYVTELYGSIKVVTRDFTVSTYASGLLNFNPTGDFPGSGEQGLAGIVVDPTSGDIFAARVNSTSSNPNDNTADHYPQVLRLTSNDGGHTAASISVILNMPGETQGQSHFVSNLSIGPDGKLYVHMGDGFDSWTAEDLDWYRGKILRMNLNGTAATDNPFYNASNGINARDYVFAYGVRNPFGGAWRASDGKHYEVENGPYTDRFAQINRGADYGWNGVDETMQTNAIYNWNPAHAPVNIAFVQSSTFAGSQFPAGSLDHAFVSESGPTYAGGPQTLGKRIVEFVLDASGHLISGPTPFVEYTGGGMGSVVGLAAGPDGLYFTELYKDLNASSPVDPGARIFRVRYVNPLNGDYDINGVVNQNDHTTWRANFGSNLLLGADGNHNNVVDAADYVLWRKNLGSTGGQGSSQTEQNVGAIADSANQASLTANAASAPILPNEVAINTSASHSPREVAAAVNSFLLDGITSLSARFNTGRPPHSTRPTPQVAPQARDSALLSLLIGNDSKQSLLSNTENGSNPPNAFELDLAEDQWSSMLESALNHECRARLL
jgi:glucose/arabinose dehydrogenase